MQRWDRRMEESGDQQDVDSQEWDCDMWTFCSKNEALCDPTLTQNVDIGLFRPMLIMRNGETTRP
eukprot:12883044-Prorocentrum_lima.AAC.1